MCLAEVFTSHRSPQPKRARTSDSTERTTRHVDSFQEAHERRRVNVLQSNIASLHQAVAATILQQDEQDKK